MIVGCEDPNPQNRVGPRLLGVGGRAEGSGLNRAVRVGALFLEDQPCGRRDNRVRRDA
jgi:hypothetical protein